MATKRHRGKYDPTNPSPYELSRSKIEDLHKCEACFWLEKKAGVKRPSMPAFLINSLTDVLLKREMDLYRGEEAHPWLANQGFSHLIPFAHDDLEDWTDSLQFGASSSKYNTLHEETNILFGGGIDDMFLNTKTGECVLVDFKSTADITKAGRKLDLSGPYKEGYKRQMDMYHWIGKRKGLRMSKDSYFFYVDGQNAQTVNLGDAYDTGSDTIKRLSIDGMNVDPDTGVGWLQFNASFLHYEPDDSWVEDALFRAKEVLEMDECPPHSEGCEHGNYIANAAKATV